MDTPQTISTPHESTLRPKPLADPLRVLSQFFLIFSILGLVMAGIFGLIAMSASAQAPEARTNLFGAAMDGLGAASMSFALFILIRPHRTVNAFYLRAFSSDDRTVEIRRRLARLLGKEFRLSGIRPPPKRTPPFARFFAAGWMALRYAGSKHMDLEAGDDWLARLMASFSGARVAFLDVRLVTPQVRNEIILAWKQLGPNRCVFIVDDTKPLDEWRQDISNWIGLAEEQESLRLAIDVATRDSFFETVKGMLETIPAEGPGFEPEAVVFVREIVAPESWTKGWMTQQLAQAIMGFVAAALFFWLIGFLSADGQLLTLVLVLPIGLAAWGLLVVALCRAAANGARIRAAVAAMFALGCLAAFAASAHVKMSPIARRADQIATRSRLHIIEMGVMLFELEQERPLTPEEGLKRLVPDYLSPDTPLIDQWGEPYYFRRVWDSKCFVIGSSGPDRGQDTPDDITVAGGVPE